MRLAVCRADSAKDWPRCSSTVSRQISTPAEASSIRLSEWMDDPHPNLGHLIGEH